MKIEEVLIFLTISGHLPNTYVSLKVKFTARCHTYTVSFAVSLTSYSKGKVHPRTSHEGPEGE
jgi:hypothetical protein